jgi:hypothetical protein
MTRVTLRQDSIDRRAERANGSFGLFATKRGHRQEIDRSNQAG